MNVMVPNNALTVGHGIEMVTTDWLERNMDREDLDIVDCQPDIHDYIEAHVPGAVHFDQGHLRIPQDGIPGVWIPVDVACPLISRIGLDRERPVIVYSGKGLFKGNGDGLEHSMVAYSLARFGHDNVKVLDGGLDKWLAEGRPASREFPRKPGREFQAELRSQYTVDYYEFLRIKDREDVLVLDARPKELYEGQGPWSKPGHIPGAVSLPWRSLMEDDDPYRFKPMGEIRVLIENAGVGSDRDIICTCGTGREATIEFLLLRFFLGNPRVRIYEGSFTEWVSHADNPVVTGPNPR